MKMNWLCFANILFGIGISLSVNAQPKSYSVANAHSHNDYENPIPFFTAYEAGFGSIEADIFLVGGQLFVAHDTVELKTRRTLRQYYLDPLIKAVQKNNGHAFADSGAILQMLIDIKTDSIHTLNALIEILRQIPSLSKNNTIKWVITGNRPSPWLFSHYPAFIFFDGVLSKEYAADALSKIVMMSADFRKYSSWRGNGEMPPPDYTAVMLQITKAHQLHKPVRFWDAPDTKNSWIEFEHLGVDFINTDRIRELADFLNRH